MHIKWVRFSNGGYVLQKVLVILTDIKLLMQISVPIILTIQINLNTSQYLWNQYLYLLAQNYNEYNSKLIFRFRHI